MNAPAKTGNPPKSRRFETIVFLLLCSLVVMVSAAALNYLYIDRPAVRAQKESQRLIQQLMEDGRKNQRLLEQKLAEATAQAQGLRLQLELIKAESQLAKASAEPARVPDPAVAAAPSQQERQRLERVKVVDELVDSLMPNLQVRFQPKVTWLERAVSLDFSLTNSGRRAVRVAQPRISLTLNPAFNARVATTMPKSGDVQIEVCPAGFIGPGETINCSVLLRSEVPFTGVGSIPFQANISARTDLPANSETWKTARSAYKDAYLEARMTKTVAFNGELWR